MGKPQDVDGPAAAVEGPEYAVAVGMVRYGFANPPEESGFSLREWIMGLFGRG